MPEMTMPQAEAIITTVTGLRNFESPAVLDTAKRIVAALSEAVAVVEANGG